ncbi:hypothetical protein [Flavobacterium aestuarii]|uniref:hypothetical protein n=1 Tax=Flavobacterium aestuarii TaxID=3149227 RepID=UPI0032B58191
MDKVLLENTENIVEKSKKDWCKDLSSEKKHEIEIGLSEADNDQLIRHKETMSQFHKWH